GPGTRPGPDDSGTTPATGCTPAPAGPRPAVPDQAVSPRSSRAPLVVRSRREGGLAALPVPPPNRWIRPGLAGRGVAKPQVKLRPRTPPEKGLEGGRPVATRPSGEESMEGPP